MDAVAIDPNATGENIGQQTKEPSFLLPLLEVPVI